MCNIRATRIVLIVILFEICSTAAQAPPRLSIPGAVLVSQHKPSLQYRQQRIQQPEAFAPPRLRSGGRPPQNSLPGPIRPVIEEPEENEPPQNTQFLTEDVENIGIGLLQTAVRQSQGQEEQEEEPPRPVPFRPERPVPLLRQDIRENSNQARPVPFRQELRQEPRPVPVTRPPIRQELREEVIQRQPPPQPIRQQPRIQQQQPQQTFRQQKVQQPRPQSSQYDEQQRKRKPPVQILRKYRTDNPDGSITWGYENEDGSFKEETIGVDCVIRGKYGYIDPDDVRREYTYETGNKCDQLEEEEEELAQLPPGKNIPQQAPRKQQQFRPQPPAQYT